jgi:CO/xanthine dehydrogenase FAD-binding subunit
MAEYLQPESITDAANLIAQHGDALAIMAGGTSAMRFVVPYVDYVLGVRRLGLERVEKTGDGWSLGAAASLSRVCQVVPIAALQDAARQVGGVAIQNMATIGGNIFAHPPYGDAAVALLALDARVTIVDADGERSLPLAEYYNGGIKNSGLLTKVEFDEPAGETVFLKCGRTRHNATTVVSLAVRLVKDGGKAGDIRIALGGVARHPMRCIAAEEALAGGALDAVSIGKAAAAASEAGSPATDAVATEWYRRRMAGVYLRRALDQLA